MGANNKRVMVERIRRMAFWRAYRFCRHAGETPWCSVRMAVWSRL
jgi:hypothetical protein